MMRIFALLLLAAWVNAQSAPEVEITAEPHHHLAFANNQVRVFNAEIPPHSESLMHWHRYDYFYIPLGDSEIINVVKGKDPISLKLHDGETEFRSAIFAHVTRNPSDTSFRAVVIELPQDEKLRRSNFHWDEERGLEILEGGTQEILFAKDGVRASDFQLQPNAATPARSHSGALLLVAVNDLDLITNTAHTHTAHESMRKPTHFKAGDAVWLAAGFRLPIVNAGQTTARFVVLEFPDKRS